MVYHGGVYAAGTVVAGKYRLESLLGQGGMGVVIAATHLHLGTPVALKLLHSEMVHNQVVVDRFMREARASAQLRSENVCRVSDVGMTEDGCPFIVMELLNGHDLTSVLHANGTMPVPMAAEVVLQACSAIGEAHALGIVHRDLKPGNLFWTQRPDGTVCIKVLDFGVAKGPEDVNFSLTQTSSMIGSPGYMSPEQLKSSKTVDGRGDIWSLGVVMYELVTGRKPFEGESITELALKVTMDPTPPMRGHVPSAFESVVRRCLEKDAARRYQDVADLAAALAPFVGTRGFELAQGVARVRRGANPPFVPVISNVASTPTTLRGANGVISGGGATLRSWRLPALIGMGAACGIGLAILIASGKKDTHEPASAPMEETTTMHAEPTAPPPAAPTVEVKPTERAVETVPDPKTEAAKTEAAKTEAAKAEAARLEAEKASAANAEVARLKAEKADAAKAEVARHKAEKADAARAEVARHKAEKAEAAKAKTAVKKETETKPPKTEDVGDSRF